MRACLAGILFLFSLGLGFSLAPSYQQVMTEPPNWLGARHLQGELDLRTHIRSRVSAQDEEAWVEVLATAIYDQEKLPDNQRGTTTSDRYKHLASFALEGNKEVVAELLTQTGAAFQAKPTPRADPSASVAAIATSVVESIRATSDGMPQRARETLPGIDLSVPRFCSAAELPTNIKHWGKMPKLPTTREKPTSYIYCSCRLIGVLPNKKNPSKKSRKKSDEYRTKMWKLYGNVW